MKRVGLIIFALVILAAGLVGCASNKKEVTPAVVTATPVVAKETPKKVESIELIYQSHVTPNLTAEFYDTAIKRFEASNPGIKIKRIQAPDADADKYLKLLLASGDFPDIAQNISDIIAFVKSDALIEIKADDDIKKIKNYNVQSINGKLYNLGAFTQPQSLIFYNKKMFADAGITATPKNWDEFIKVSEKLKAKGFTPMLTAGEWVTGFTAGIMSAPDIFGKNMRWNADRTAGKVHFTDAEWVEAMTRFADFSKKGYFNKGALSIGYTQVEQEFLKGNGAMYPMGVWFTASEKNAKDKNFEVGVFPVPTKDGEVRLAGAENGGMYAISSKSKHPVEALKFIKFMLLDVETHKKFMEADGLFSNLVNPISIDFTPLQKEVAELLRTAKVYSPYMALSLGDSSPAAGIWDQFQKTAQNLMVAQDPLKELKILDDIWDKNVKK